MRLIDADALNNEAGKLWSEMPDGEELSKELMKAINHAPTVDTDINVAGTWVSVDDRLPEKNGVYITFCDDEGVFSALYERGRKQSEWTDDYEGYLDFDVTHWMPLPEPPKEVSEE